MYPSQKDPVYGTFVEVFVKNIRCQNTSGQTDIIVIRGRNGKLLTKLWKYIKFYISIFFSLIFRKYDIIYVHTITYPIPPILLVSYFKTLPLVLNVHGGDVLTRGIVSTLLKKTSARLLKKAKLIVSPSNFFKQILINEFPFLSNNQIFISPSGGVEAIFFNNKTKQNETFTMGYVSRIDEAKGWDVFLQALSLLVKRGIKIQAIIVGRGAKTKDMLKMIESLSLDAYVHYIGPVPYVQLPNIYSMFDLFVFPTYLEESLGLVGLEAMASGIPVVGSKIGGLQDYIIHNYNGYLFSPLNANELAYCVETYLSLPEERQIAMQNNAFHTALQYDSKLISTKLYEKIISL